MNTQTPYEQLRFINDVIKDRKDKNQNTFFSVKLERFGKQTPLVDKENGETFYETLIQYLTRYDISTIIIELFHGKAHNIKEPFQVFQIPLKRNPDTSLGYIEKGTKEDITITPAESVITTEKHFSTIIDKERQVLFLDFELKKLQSENEELRKKNKKRKQYIEELEAALDKNEKAKKQSLGNVSLGLVASNAIENIAKSSFGIGLLKNVLGVNEETLNGLLGTDNTDNKQSSPSEPKSTATIITKPKESAPQSEEEKVRQYLLKELNSFFSTLDSGALRLYFEIIKAIGKDQVKLQQVYMAVKIAEEKANPSVRNIKQQNISPQNEASGKHEETETDENETDPDDSS